MAGCSGIKADGGRCRAQAIVDSQWCFSHHPGYEEQRRRRASRGGKRGGRGRPQADLAEIKDRIRSMIDEVRNGTMDRADAAVCAQLYNSLLRAVSVELKVREQLELEQRVEELEHLLERQDEHRRSQAW